MPLPMVHLAIAVRLYARNNLVPPPPFLLGSLAPDAIHMRPNVTRADKDITHLGKPSTTHDAAPLKTFVQRAGVTDQMQHAFLVGYVAHILADRRWTATVIPHFSQALPSSVSADERRTVYYQETDQIDFNLYHHAPWRPVTWMALATAAPLPAEALLTAAEIGQWRDRTLVWFDLLKEEPRITPTYITDMIVATFIEETVAALHDTFDTWDMPLQHVAPGT